MCSATEQKMRAGAAGAANTAAESTEKTERQFITIKKLPFQTATFFVFIVLLFYCVTFVRIAIRQSSDDHGCAALVELFHRAKISRDGAGAGADELF